MSADAGVQAQFDQYESEQRFRYGLSEIEDREREIERLKKRIDADIKHLKEQQKVIQNQDDLIRHLKKNMEHLTTTNQKLLKVVGEANDIISQKATGKN